MPEGILLINKPVGWTSFDVVGLIRRKIALSSGVKPRMVKVGHTGTLDPFAQGLLIILVGNKYTKKMPEFLKLDKIYQVNMVLGKNSTTGDPEGEISAVSEKIPEKLEIQDVLKKFVGEIEQTPPIYSAIKIQGVRAYKLARQGKQFDVPSRKIRINSIALIDYEYPEVKFIADVSSGTYIRTLVSDIGKYLATGAYTKELIRTKIGKYSLDRAIDINKDSDIGDILNNLIKLM